MIHAAASFQPLLLRIHKFPSNLNSSISVLRCYYQPSNELLCFFDQLLQQCITIQHCKQIHANVIVTGNYCSAFLAARKVSVYARFGCLIDAHKTFDTTPCEGISNLLLWNAILRANVSHGYYQNALKLYARMRKVGVFGDGFTFPLVTRACAFIGYPTLCRTIHCHAFQLGFQSHLYVGNELMGMYAKLGQMENALNVFDRMTVKSYISWNTMVSGYAFNYDCNGAFKIVQRMQIEGLEPNLVTWTSLMSSYARSGYLEETLEFFDLMRSRGTEVTAEAIAVVLSACAGLSVFDRGKVIHGYVIKGGFEDYLFVKTALVSVYGKHGDVNCAHKLFAEMKNKTIATWNTLITSHAEAGLCDAALEIFLQLRRSDQCSKLRPNVVTWSAVIDGFASNGHGEESLELFRQMQNARVSANGVTIATVLSICAELAALQLGREIHGNVIRTLMDKNILVQNGLLNMYTKCGCFTEGHAIFERINTKDLITWNSMIMGYGMHGLGRNALETFDQMINLGFKPDGVTFIALLSACSHAGLVPEGRKLFDQARREYKIEPQMEHYACMIDLLGRAGLLQEASEIIKNMPIEPNACVWSAFLNSCRMHNNTEIAEETASRFNLNLQEMTRNSMLLSHIYAARGRWEDSARVRMSARTKGLKKNPGQSWIKLKKNVYTFSANNVQEGLEQVYRILDDLTLQMKTQRHEHEIEISTTSSICW
ncbi:putative pentatricopeptide repeat-containing protein At1g17630 [Euphorbia lathyris]|uniref:putative pentatricopeptide repeat-containing protein At1g17630 n=1 Tax=Euphorbia lathyris TaxID=212925 RepID=UPI00331417DC